MTRRDRRQFRREMREYLGEVKSPEQVKVEEERGLVVIGPGDVLAPGEQVPMLHPLGVLSFPSPNGDA